MEVFHFRHTIGIVGLLSSGSSFRRYCGLSCKAIASKFCCRYLSCKKHRFGGNRTLTSPDYKSVAPSNRVRRAAACCWHLVAQESCASAPGRNRTFTRRLTVVRSAVEPPEHTAERGAFCAFGSAPDPLCSLNIIRFQSRNHGKKVANSVFSNEISFGLHLQPFTDQVGKA